MIITVNRPAPLHTNVKADRVEKDGKAQWRSNDKATGYVMLAPGDNEVDEKVGKAICEMPTFKAWASEKLDSDKPWVEVTKR